MSGVARSVIPFSRPFEARSTLERLQAVLDSGHAHGDGPLTATATAKLRALTDGGDLLLTTSGTHALEMASHLLDLGPGDEVVLPTFTFSSAATAVTMTGATVVFVDVEGPSGNVDVTQLAEAVGPATKALSVMHYGGQPVDMDAVMSIARERGLSVIEDNAHGLFGRWRGRPLGSFGAFTSLSFHETKNFTCGEGGALLVNDPAAVDRARILYDKGTNRRAFFLGQVDKYSWVDTGSSFGLSDMLAATLLAQLEKRDQIQAKRRHVHESYLAALAPYTDLGVTLPSVPDDCDPAYHLFYVLMPDKPTRDRVMETMRQEGINPTFHYVPLHSSIGGRRFAARETDCPVTTDVSERLMRMPFFNGLTGAQLERIVESFGRALKAAG